MQQHTFQEGDRVLIVTEKKKRYMVQLRSGKKFHTSEGFIDLSNLIGQPSGCVLHSNTGAVMHVFKPTFLDLLMFLPRTTQIVYPKDLGYIAAVSGVGPGYRVVEAGTGTGVLAAFLTYLVRPTGRVYSYDVRLENIETATVRMRQLGLLDYIELKQGDVCEKIVEKELDAAVIDIPEPWRAVQSCYDALKPSGVWVSLSPTVEQVVQTYEALEAGGFSDLSCVELLLRNMRVKRGMTRPEFLMRGHTTYLVTARKILR